MSNSSFKLSALAIACGLALSACSSGGETRQVLSLPRLFRVRQTRRLVKVERLKLLHPVKTVVRCRPLQGLEVAQEATRRRRLITTIMKEVRQEAIQPNHLQPKPMLVQ